MVEHTDGMRDHIDNGQVMGNKQRCEAKLLLQGLK